MNLERFEETLSRLGGDLRRWPAPERGEAEVLIAAEPRAAKLQAQAAELDALLGAAVAPATMDAAAIGRIMAGIGQGRRHDLTLQPTRRLFAWASAAMVALLVAGFAAGVAMPTSQGEDTLAGLVFGSNVSTSADSGSVL